MSIIDLSRCPICSHIPVAEQESFIENLHGIQKKIDKNDLIFRQGELCKYLYLLTKGTVKTEMMAEDGTLLTIEILHAPYPLAPAFLFGENNRFPVDAIAMEECELLLIPKEAVMKMMATNENFLSNYLSFNAGRIQFLSNKLQIMSVRTIKGKLAQYILEQLPPGSKTLTLDKNQTQLAEYFGVARPSLSRSISEMTDAGLIRIDKKQITILDFHGLKRLLA